MNLKEIKLRKGMTREEVKEILKITYFKEEIYLGWDYKHTWRCPSCDKFEIKRAWRDLRKGLLKCDRCRYNIKDSYNSISEVYIRQHMSKDEVNNLISKWLLLEDSIYKGVKTPHNWRCKCGNLIENRTFDTIRTEKAYRCKMCVTNSHDAKGIKRITLEKGMSKEKVNLLIKDFVELEDEVFKGVAHTHNWRCKCNNIFKRRWSSIRENEAFNCGCKRFQEREQDHKREIEKCGDYEYIKTLKRGEELSNGKIAVHSDYIQVRHKYCNSIYENRPSDFILQGRRCTKCCGSYEKSFAYHIEQELGLDINDVWDFEKNTVNPYHISKKARIKVWIKCRKVNYHESYETYCYSFAVSKNGCPYCKNRKIHYRDSFGYKNPDKVKNWHRDNPLSPFEVAPTTPQKYKFECFECGNIWATSLGNVSNGCWCPSCKISKGEKRIKKYLDNNKVSYIHDSEYFKDLVGLGGGTLRPDFILPYYKIWIEYDGEFHYKNMYEGDGYKTLKAHDKLKDEYAKKHNWKLIRIPYWEFDNIESILDKILIYNKE